MNRIVSPQCSFYFLDGLEKRLRLILDDLLGPSHSSASKSVWDPVILVIIY